MKTRLPKWKPTKFMLNQSIKRLRRLTPSPFLSTTVLWQPNAFNNHTSTLTRQINARCPEDKGYDSCIMWANRNAPGIAYEIILFDFALSNVCIFASEIRKVFFEEIPPFMHKPLLALWSVITKTSECRNFKPLVISTVVRRSQTVNYT